MSEVLVEPVADVPPAPTPGGEPAGEPGILIVQTGGATQVEEGGATDTVTIALATAPTAEVVVLVTGDYWQVSPNPDDPWSDVYLTFTPDDWNVPQTVTVTAIDDTDPEEAGLGGLYVSTIGSDDPAYNYFFPQNGSVSVSVTDNDSGGTGNTAPSALDVATDTYDTDLGIDVEGFGYDTESNVTYQIVSQPAEGTVTVLPGGTFHFEGHPEVLEGLKRGEIKPVTFQYQVSDGELTSDPAAITINVHGTDPGDETIEAFTRTTFSQTDFFPLDGKDGNDTVVFNSVALTSGSGLEISLGKAIKWTEYNLKPLVNIENITIRNTTGDRLRTMTVGGDDQANVITIENTNHKLAILGRGDDDTITFKGTGNGLTSVINGGAGDDTVNAQSAVIVNVADGNDTVNVFTGSNVTVQNFTRGDKINFAAGIEASTVSAAVQGADTVFTINQDGVTSTVTVTGATGLVAGTDWTAEGRAPVDPDNHDLGSGGPSGQRPTAADDILDDGAALSSTLHGLGGNDTLYGRDMTDTLIGGAGNDTLYGGSGDDLIRGDGGPTDLDTPNGARNAGAPGADFLYGGDGNDILHGQDGDDLLVGGHGADILVGGLGDDTYLVDTIGDRVVEAAGEGLDTVISTVSHALANHVETLVLSGSATEGLAGFGNARENTITGDAGANRLDGKRGADSLSGGDGDDLLVDRDGADLLAGGDGNDTYLLRGAGLGVAVIQEAMGAGEDIVRTVHGLTLGANLEDAILLGAAAAHLIGNELDNGMRGNNAANILSGLGGDDRLQGHGGDDRLRGQGGDDLLFGGDGADSLMGGAGDDKLQGGAGNDRLYGDPGNDVMTGGSGADLFIFRDAFSSDLIADFEGGTDRIHLADFREENDGSALTFGQILITQLAGRTRIEFDLDRNGVSDRLDLDGDGSADAVRIDLSGFTATDLQADDFVF